jgi:hypothetical protein
MQVISIAGEQEIRHFWDYLLSYLSTRRIRSSEKELPDPTRIKHNRCWVQGGTSYPTRGVEISYAEKVDLATAFEHLRLLSRQNGYNFTQRMHFEPADTLFAGRWELTLVNLLYSPNNPKVLLEVRFPGENKGIEAALGLTKPPDSVFYPEIATQGVWNCYKNGVWIETSAPVTAVLKRWPDIGDIAIKEFAQQTKGFYQPKCDPHNIYPPEMTITKIAPTAGQQQMLFATHTVLLKNLDL